MYFGPLYSGIGWMSEQVLDKQVCERETSIGSETALLRLEWLRLGMSWRENLSEFLPISAPGSMDRSR